MKFQSISKFLKQPVDNASLVVFRIAFGFLIAAESFGAILTGWVKRAFIDPEFTFSFIGFEWLQPLPGYGMHFYYGVMGITGIMVMIGLFYRHSLLLFTLLWWGTYLMQKTSYNNHYYLLILLCFLMLLVPAHRNASYDVQLNRINPTTSCPRWCIDIFKWQLMIVFTYAALAKLYTGWLDGDFIRVIFSSKAGYPLIGNLLQQQWLQKLVIIGGIAYDLTIIPLMYRKGTRKVGLVISIVFHMFNSIVFGIGIFPYLMIASMVLFFNVSHWQPRIPGFITQDNESHYQTPGMIYPVLLLYFALQLWLPIRHYFIPGDVLVTEEGHRMAWRMMLRSKYGSASFRLVDKNSGKSWVEYPRQYLTNKQVYKMGGRPDMIWQFSRYLARQHAKQGIDSIEIYVNTNFNINGTNYSPLIDPNVNLLGVEWNRWGHNFWINGYLTIDD